MSVSPLHDSRHELKAEQPAHVFMSWGRLCPLSASLLWTFVMRAAKEQVVGWYSTGPKLRESDLDIQELFYR